MTQPIFTKTGKWDVIIGFGAGITGIILAEITSRYVPADVLMNFFARIIYEYF